MLKECIVPEDMKKWNDLLLVHKFAVEEIYTKLKILDEEFKNTHDYNPIEYIKYRIKEQASIIEKLQRRGFEATIENAWDNIYDIGGLRIICSFTSDIYTVYKLIEKIEDLRIVEVKDYIKRPKPNGYKSLHVHVETNVYLSSGPVKARIEIQIRTIAMDFWASLEHKIYYKYKNAAPSIISDQLKACANLITILDDRMLEIKNLITDLNEIDLVKGTESVKDNDVLYKDMQDDII